MKASELIRLLQQYSPDTEIPVSFTPSGRDGHEISVASCDEGERSRCYQNIVELAREGMIILDPRDHVTYMNPFMQAILEYPSTELAGQPLASFLAPEHADFSVTQLYRNGRPDSRRALRMVSRSGNLYWVQISATPIPSPDDRSRGSLLTVTDLTHQQDHQEHLEDQQSLGEKVNGVTEQLETLKRLRLNLMDEARELQASERIQGRVYWHRNRYLYIVYPQKNGQRVRTYIGSQPERVNAALAAVRREQRYREVCTELEHIDSRIRTVSFKLDSFLLELGNLPPQWHVMVS